MNRKSSSSPAKRSNAPRDLAAHASARRPTNRYCTPDGELVLERMFWPSGADLDAFHDPESRVLARRVIDVRLGGDAYRDDWATAAMVEHPRVHVNGPYSGRFPQATAERCAVMAEAGCEIMSLCPAACGSAYWVAWVWPYVSAIAWLGRLSFRAACDLFDAHGKRVARKGDEVHGNRTEIARCYYGPRVDDFAAVWRSAGRVVTILPARSLSTPRRMLRA